MTYKIEEQYEDFCKYMFNNVDLLKRLTKDVQKECLDVNGIDDCRWPDCECKFDNFDY